MFVDVLKNIILLQLKISHLAHQISRIIINLSLSLIDDAGQFVFPLGDISDERVDNR